MERINYIIIIFKILPSITFLLYTYIYGYCSPPKPTPYHPTCIFTTIILYYIITWDSTDGHPAEYYNIATEGVTEIIDRFRIN